VVRIFPVSAPGRRVGDTLDFKPVNIRSILPSMPNPMDTTSAALAATPLTDSEYQRLTAAVLASIETTVDGWLEADLIDIDTHRTGGLLELSFPGGSKIILNTQPPLHELWMAARAGGFHYRHVDGRWRDTRDGSEFFAALSAQASAQGGQPLSFVAPT
jgi:CyaY protein